jgi:hypothetical protein
MEEDSFDFPLYSRKGRAMIKFLAGSQWLTYRGSVREIS